MYVIASDCVRLMDPDNKTPVPPILVAHEQAWYVIMGFLNKQRLLLMLLLILLLCFW